MRRHRQQGAIIVTVALFLLFLLGFMGIALDFGRMFIVKTELQTAVDSCALAAAQELDGQLTAITRAQSAGLTAGNLNNVNMQSPNWRGQPKLDNSEITFRDAAYNANPTPANARYAQCAHTQRNIQMFLLHILGAFLGNPTELPRQQSVGAFAVATRGSAQTTCPIPLALKPKAGGTAPNYGFTVGEWVTVLGDRTPNSGEIGWYNLDGTTSARQTKDQFEDGTCGTRVGDQLGTPGAKTSVDVVWNYRFGIYKMFELPSAHSPDFSGYSYTATNWANRSININGNFNNSAWDGIRGASAHATADNFLSKRAAFASFDNNGTSLTSGSSIVFGVPNRLNSFRNLATPLAGGEHQRYGFNRRLATVPVIDANRRVINYVCVFMLHPLTGPQDDAKVEFRGNAGALNSPCGGGGLPGGTAGPLVPVLVR